MQKLRKTTLIEHTYQNVVATGLFSEVLVATESDAIQNKMVVNPQAAIGIDTSEDQKKVKQFLNNLS